MKDRALSDKVELPHNNLTKGGHILHEKEYNTGDGISAIPNEVCLKIWCKSSQSEIQQESVIYLLLACAVGWKRRVFGLPVTPSSPSSKAAHRCRIEADSGYAAPQPQAGDGGAVAPAEAARLYPSPRKPVSCNEKTWDVSSS